MNRILLADDDEGLVHFLARALEKSGDQVVSFRDGPSALQAIATEEFDLIILDYKMPGMNGLETLKEIRARQVKTPVIIITAYGTTETTIEAMRMGAYDFLQKPFDTEELRRVVADALRLNRLMKEVVNFPTAVPGPAGPHGEARIVGSSRKMQEVFKLIGQVADKDVTILITGESGTGKELVARAVYHHSRRRDLPFLAVNCAAIPESLFESELFGYERGAFTGAEQVHLGKFERCQGGTIFFDEVGDLGLATQAKVLRVLQESELERIGGSRTIKVDVRVIAATNKNLARAIETGQFRADLFWRLNIISIPLPPLRERMEDLPALCDYFIARFSLEYQKPVRKTADEAIRKLASYPWPGNVRELENTLRRAVLLCSGEIISAEHVLLGADPAAGLSSERTLASLEDKIEQLLPEIMQLTTSTTRGSVIEIVEKILIEKTLRECGHNQVKAAKALGISRNTLRLRMQKYNLAARDGEV